MMGHPYQTGTLWSLVAPRQHLRVQWPAQLLPVIIPGVARARAKSKNERSPKEVWAGNRAPEIVLAPNLENSPTFGSVYDDFIRTRGRMRLEDWTCKKTAKPGDLYLFYFGLPRGQIAGLAVCSEPPDPAGWKEPRWNNRQKMFFCSFDRLHHLRFPVGQAELESNGLGAWWSTRPYHGRPKTISPEAARTLLELIVRREPNTAPLLLDYIQLTGTAEEDRVRLPEISALEGTSFERLSRQPVRSRALREAKIRDAMARHGRLVCEVPGCGFDFYEVYGEIGRGFAHVHHRRSLARRKAGRTKLSDLAIVCANCHAMLHQWGGCRSLKGLIQGPSKSSR